MRASRRLRKIIAANKRAVKQSQEFSSLENRSGRSTKTNPQISFPFTTPSTDNKIRSHVFSFVTHPRDKLQWDGSREKMAAAIITRHIEMLVVVFAQSTWERVRQQLYCPNVSSAERRKHVRYVEGWNVNKTNYVN